MGVGIEDFRVVPGMNELQELGDKFDLDQAATGPLDIPKAGRALLLHHQAAHVKHILAGGGRITLGAQTGGNGL